MPVMSEDPIIRRATDRRDAALREAAKWDAFIKQYVELQGEPVPPNSVRTDQRGPPRIFISGRLSETEHVAAEIIKERGRAIPTRDLLVELENRGVEVGGKDPASTLSARLSRSSVLVGRRGIGWSLKPEAPQKDEAAGSPGSEPAASTHTSGVPSEAHSGHVEPAAGGGT